MSKEKSDIDVIKPGDIVKPGGKTGLKRGIKSPGVVNPADLNAAQEIAAEFQNRLRAEAQKARDEENKSRMEIAASYDHVQKMKLAEEIVKDMKQMLNEGREGYQDWSANFWKIVIMFNKFMEFQEHSTVFTDLILSEFGEAPFAIKVLSIVTGIMPIFAISALLDQKLTAVGYKLGDLAEDSYPSFTIKVLAIVTGIVPILAAITGLASTLVPSSQTLASAKDKVGGLLYSSKIKVPDLTGYVKIGPSGQLTTQFNLDGKPMAAAEKEANDLKRKFFETPVLAYLDTIGYTPLKKDDKLVLDKEGNFILVKKGSPNERLTNEVFAEKSQHPEKGLSAWLNKYMKMNVHLSPPEAPAFRP